MKCKVTMKCPDSLDQAIYEFVNDILDQEDFEDQEDFNYEHERLVEKYKEKAKKWFKWGELVTLEMDFEQNTCKVVEQ
jgi:hypothetical protein